MTSAVFFRLTICAVAALPWLMLCPSASAKSIPIYDVNVVEQRAIDRTNFTQGLLIWDHALWVSSGLYGQSFIARYDWPSVTMEHRAELPDRWFAEGLTELDGLLYMLTWRSEQLLTVEPTTLDIIDTWPIRGEGWGITSDGDHLWISDGTHRLSVWKDKQLLRLINVTLNGKNVTRLNELEWINGEIWANVWLTDQIVRIDPASGTIIGIIDLTGLLPRTERRQDTDVLNGIASDPSNGAVWVSGKRWPYLYRIELIERQPQ